MEIKQIHELVNGAVANITGVNATLINEDLTNVVDVGESILNANALDAYVKALINQIGRIVFVNRVYKGSAPSVLRDGWEYGSVLEKIRSTQMPEVTVNESWELNDGQSYDDHIFHQPKVAVKFFNKMVTFEIDLSFTERQVKQSFQNATQLNAFLSMLMTSVENKLTVAFDGLIMRTINNSIATTLKDAYPGGDYSARSTKRAVNLLKLYKEADSSTDVQALTPAEAIINPGFIRFASYTIRNYAKWMTKMSTVFNIGGVETFTPADKMHIVLLDTFYSAEEAYLYSGSGQFSTDGIRLPDAETVAFWQGSGDKFEFGDVSSIDIKTSQGDDVKATGILGIIFDHEALGVNNQSRRTTTSYTASAEFYTNYYKADAQYFNDFNENGVVFFVA